MIKQPFGVWSPRLPSTSNLATASLASPNRHRSGGEQRIDCDDASLDALSFDDDDDDVSSVASYDTLPICNKRSFSSSVTDSTAAMSCNSSISSSSSSFSHVAAAIQTTRVTPSMKPFVRANDMPRKLSKAYMLTPASPKQQKHDPRRRTRKSSSSSQCSSPGLSRRSNRQNSETIDLNSFVKELLPLLSTTTQNNNPNNDGKTNNSLLLMENLYHLLVDQERLQRGDVSSSSRQQEQLCHERISVESDGKVCWGDYSGPSRGYGEDCFVRFENGNMYLGSMNAKRQFHGIGRLCYRNGTMQRGRFENGSFMDRST